MKRSISSLLAITAFVIAPLASNCASAQEQGELYSDPATGIVYRKVIRSIERPVYETKMEKKEQLVYRPETVTETVPESRNVFVPETDYVWQPMLHNRWNPFVPATITYHHVPRTQWKQKSDTVARTQTRTKWIAENRTVNVPTRVVSMKREQKVDYEAVGRIAPKQAIPPNNTSSAIAARLRPVDKGEQVQQLASQAPSSVRGLVQPPPFIALGAQREPYNAAQQYRAPGAVTPPSYTGVNRRPSLVAQGWQNRGINVAAKGSSPRPSTAPISADENFGKSFGTRPFGAGSGQKFHGDQIAASSVGRMTSDPPRRSVNQGGMRTTDLRPSVPTGFGQSLPPSTGGTGIANMPWSLWR